jgi:hypothetical protein
LQLSKEEEGEAGPDAQVTKEDQDKINAFSRLHNRERGLEEELQAKQVGGILSPVSCSFLQRHPLFLALLQSLLPVVDRSAILCATCNFLFYEICADYALFLSLQKDKEDLEEVSTELELADEDELVPYVLVDALDKFHALLTFRPLQLQDRRLIHILASV